MRAKLILVILELQQDKKKLNLMMLSNETDCPIIGSFQSKSF